VPGCAVRLAYPARAACLLVALLLRGSLRRAACRRRRVARFRAPSLSASGSCNPLRAASVYWLQVASSTDLSPRSLACRESLASLGHAGESDETLRPFGSRSFPARSRWSLRGYPTPRREVVARVAHAQLESRDSESTPFTLAASPGRQPNPPPHPPLRSLRFASNTAARERTHAQPQPREFV
jgi:hypothetical protein